jgi:phenylacetate-CoA ligase
MDMKNNYEKLITKNLVDSKHFSYTTSGSSGVPMTLLHDYKSHFYAFANILYCFKECGVNFRDKFVDLFSLPFSDGSLVSKPISSRLYFLGLNLNITKLSVHSYSEFVDNINNIKPDVLYAMPNAIIDICNNKMIDISPRLVFTHGEVLTDHNRNIIESMWNTEVYNTYGSSEIPRIAFECNEHAGLHILSDSVCVETVKDNEIVRGEPGEVVITGLYNYLMPLIRYELGDIATLSDEPCSCGRNWPLIKDIQGRINDVFPLPSGRTLNRSHVLGWLKPEINENMFLISKYQFIQEKNDKIILKIVKGKKFDKSMMNNILSKIHDFLGDEKLDFEVIFANDILKEKSGKRRSMISKVN